LDEAEAVTRLEPVVSDAAAVSRQILEAVQPIEVIDGYRRYVVRFSKVHLRRVTGKMMHEKIYR
jgi:hypothetical protein